MKAFLPGRKENGADFGPVRARAREGRRGGRRSQAQKKAAGCMGVAGCHPKKKRRPQRFFATVSKAEMRLPTEEKIARRRGQNKTR